MPLQANRLETQTLFHLAILGVITPWAFGGGSTGSTYIVCYLGSLAPVLTILSVVTRRQEGRPWLRPLLPLLPLLVFDALALFAIAHPTFTLASVEGGQVFVPAGPPSAWPGNARPDLGIEKLWLLNALLLSTFNLTLAVDSRKSLRLLLFILCGNALALSVFGSIQKFVSADGLFFGKVPSPNPTFFASFIYHNHWGAYVVMALALSLALFFDSLKRPGHRDFWHSPAPAAIVALFFMAATLPLCGSRSCTLLALLLLAAASVHALCRMIQVRREQKQSSAAPLALIALTAVAALAMIFVLARPVIQTRLSDTKEQLSEMQKLGHAGARGLLYRDTWRMVMDKPAFGWGLGAYGTIFRSYNTQESADGLPQYYEHAHSDWLELLAETGFVGAICLILFFALPITVVFGTGSLSTGTTYALAGCALLAIYACIEFPFANPAVNLLFLSSYFGSLRWIRLNQSSASR